jgi:hypothetical protein
MQLLFNTKPSRQTCSQTPLMESGMCQAVALLEDVTSASLRKSCKACLLFLLWLLLCVLPQVGVDGGEDLLASWPDSLNSPQETTAKILEHLDRSALCLACKCCC